MNEACDFFHALGTGRHFNYARSVKPGTDQRNYPDNRSNQNQIIHCCPPKVFLCYFKRNKKNNTGLMVCPLPQANILFPI